MQLLQESLQDKVVCLREDNLGHCLIQVKIMAKHKSKIKIHHMMMLSTSIFPLLAKNRRILIKFTYHQAEQTQ